MDEFDPTRSQSSRLPAVPLASDERLAKLVRQEDERAFQLLYKRYQHPLYRYCRWLLQSDADAEDALQSAFISALQALRRGQRDAPVRPWLFRIAHNEAISLIRARRGENKLAGCEGQTVSLEDQVEERERLATLIADLRELTERQRAALLMRELSGLSHKEIALALGASVDAAKQSIFEARRSLTEFIEGRAMDCDQVRRMISDADGRMLRSRRVRAHVRHCALCAAFAATIADRRRRLKALTPAVPPTALAGTLARWLGGSAGGGDAGGVAGAAGKTASIGVGLAVKTSALTAAVLGLGTSIELPRLALQHRRHQSTFSSQHAHAPDAHPPAPGPSLSSGRLALSFTPPSSATSERRPVAQPRANNPMPARGAASIRRRPSHTMSGRAHHTAGRHSAGNTNSTASSTHPTSTTSPASIGQTNPTGGDQDNNNDQTSSNSDSSDVQENGNSSSSTGQDNTSSTGQGSSNSGTQGNGTTTLSPSRPGTSTQTAQPASASQPPASSSSPATTSTSPAPTPASSSDSQGDSDN